jgi:TonB family protein
VQVDASGNVTNTTLDSPGPSAYFARLATESVRQWKFFPARADGRELASAWLIKFSFSQRATEAQPTPIAP